MHVITKDRMEKMCRDAGLVPVARRNVDGFDVLIADGKSAMPAITFKKFGGDDERFAGGCYATFYFIAQGEQQIGIGRPLLFDLFHDPELSHGDKRAARINAAVADARTDPVIQRFMQKVRH